MTQTDEAKLTLPEDIDRFSNIHQKLINIYKQHGRFPNILHLGKSVSGYQQLKNKYANREDVEAGLFCEEAGFGYKFISSDLRQTIITFMDIGIDRQRRPLL